MNDDLSIKLGKMKKTENKYKLKIVKLVFNEADTYQ